MVKKFACATLALLIVCVTTISVFADEAIVTIVDFLSEFNYYASLIETRCELKLGDFDVMSLGKSGMLMKAVYNGCEILSITTDKNLEYVSKVTCTITTIVKDSANYAEDFGIWSCSPC